MRNAKKKARGPFPFGVYCNGRAMHGRSCKTTDSALQSAVSFAMQETQKPGRKAKSMPVIQVAAKRSGRVIYEVRTAPNRRILYVEHVRGHIGAIDPAERIRRVSA